MVNRDNAMADLRMAINIDDENYRAYNNLGVKYYIEGDLEESIWNYSLAITFYPTARMHYPNRGQAYFDNQEYASALADFSVAIMLDPEKNQGLCSTR